MLIKTHWLLHLLTAGIVVVCIPMTATSRYVGRLLATHQQLIGFVTIFLQFGGRHTSRC